MDVTPLIRRDAKIIQAYRDGVFKVSGEIYERAIAVLPQLVLDWTDKKAADLVAEDFALLAPFKDEIDVILLGTGKGLVWPNPVLRQDVKRDLGMVLEVMDTGAAARTYNVLMAEGRRIAALILPSV